MISPLVYKLEEKLQEKLTTYQIDTKYEFYGSTRYEGNILEQAKNKLAQDILKKSDFTTVKESPTKILCSTNASTLSGDSCIVGI